MPTWIDTMCARLRVGPTGARHNYVLRTLLLCLWFALRPIFDASKTRYPPTRGVAYFGKAPLSPTTFTIQRVIHASSRFCFQMELPTLSLFQSVITRATS